MEGWYVGANKEIVKGTEKAVKFTIDEKTKAIKEGTKAWTFDGKTSLYLWNAEKKQATEAGENLTLATAKQDILDLSSDNQVAQVSFTKVTATTVEQKADEYSVEDLQKFAIKKVGKEFYLTVDFEGTTYYVSAPTDKKEIVFSAEPNEETGKVSNDSKMGAIKVGGNWLALNKTKIVAASKNEDGTQLLRAFDEKNAWYVSESVKADNIYLAYFENTGGDAPKAARTAVTSVSRVFEFGETKTAAYDAESVNEYNTWTIEVVEGKNYLKIGNMYLALSGTDVKLSGEATSEVAVNGEGQLTLGGQALYIGDEGFTILSSDTKPAAIYAVTEGKVAAQPSDAIDTKVQYVIAQALTGAVMDVKFAPEAETVDSEQAPGAEYGELTNVVIANDGTLHFEADVDDLNVPVCIYYVNNENKKVYLNAGATWKENKAAWILDDNTLVSLDGKQSIHVEGGITYIPGGISGINIPADHVTIALAEESIHATEINNGCDIPLLNDVNSDRVILASRDDNGNPVYINMDDNGNVKLGYDWTSADLWTVEESNDLGNNRHAYIFKNRNQDGKQLEIDGYTRFMAYEYNGGVQLLGVDLNTMRTESPIIISGAGSTVTIGAGTGRAAVIGFYQSKLEQYNAASS